MPTIRIDSAIDVNFVRTGPRGCRPIVFLHPVGLDLTWWGAQVEAFGREHDVVAFDMPGHGLSGTPDARHCVRRARARWHGASRRSRLSSVEGRSTWSACRWAE